MRNTAQIVAADASAHSPTGVERYHDEGYVSASVATIEIFSRIETALRSRKLQSVELLRDPRVNPEGSWRVFGDTKVSLAEFGLLLSRVGVPLGEKELQLVILQLNERDGLIDLREVRARRRASPRPGRVRPDTHRARNGLSRSPRVSSTASFGRCGIARAKPEYYRRRRSSQCAKPARPWRTESPAKRGSRASRTKRGRYRRGVQDRATRADERGPRSACTSRSSRFRALLGIWRRPSPWRRPVRRWRRARDSTPSPPCEA